MANEIIFIYGEDSAAAKRIVGAFAEETGLAAKVHDGSTTFAVHGREHEVKVVETLNRIDGEWNRYVSLGDPRASSE